MANLNDIFGWFSIGKTPTTQQFRDTFASFFHKSEKLPQTQILGLPDALSSKADYTAVSNLTKELDGKANKSDVAISMLYLGFDVSTSSKLTKPTITNPTSNEVVTLVKGHAVKVLDQVDTNGNAYIYQYDGINWNKTPYTAFPADVATMSKVFPISPLDTTFFRKPNLYNDAATDILIGKYLDDSGNATLQNIIYITTGYIDVRDLIGSFLTANGDPDNHPNGFFRLACFYDENKKKIGSLYYNATPNILVIANAVYMRASFATTLISRSDYKIVAQRNFDAIIPFESGFIKDLPNSLVATNNVRDLNITPEKKTLFTKQVNIYNNSKKVSHN